MQKFKEFISFGEKKNDNRQFDRTKNRIGKY